MTARRVLASLLCMSYLFVAAADFDVNFLITREVRGAVYAVDSSNNQCDAPSVSFSGSGLEHLCSCSGGASRRLAYLAASSSNNTLALDTGGYFSGSGKFYPAFHGNASAEYFASSGYDAYGLTYRDFTSANPDGLATYLARTRALNPAQPRAVVTNLDTTGDVLANHVEPYTLVPLENNRTLAVLSLTDPTFITVSLASYSSRMHSFERSLATTIATLHRLPSGLPDVVVCIVSDMPTTEEEVLAAGSVTAAKTAALSQLVNEAIGVDVFVLGVMDTTTATAHVRTNWAGDAVLVLPAQDRTHGTSIESVTARFTDGGLLVAGGVSSGDITLGCQSEEDSAAASRLAVLHAEMSTRLGEAVGTLSGALDDNTHISRISSQAQAILQPCATISGSVYCGCRVSQCLQGSAISDAIASAAGAPLGMLNAGSIRAALPSGTVTKGDVLAMLPFDGEVVRVAVPGATLKAALSHAIAGLALADTTSLPSGQYLQLSSGIRFDWQYKAGVPTIAGAYAWDADGFALVNDTATYSVAMPAFIAAGGDGFTMLAGLPMERTGLTQAAAMTAYLRANSPLAVAYRAMSVDVPAHVYRIKQFPDLIVLQVGIVCAGSGAGDREQCDHMHHMADRINDKTDGFFDELLPNAFIEVAEEIYACGQIIESGAIPSVKQSLPNMVATVGVGCSSDVEAISDTTFRAANDFTQVMVSGSSTATSLADEVRYKNVARLATTEVGGGQGNADIAAHFGWRRVAVLAGGNNQVWVKSARDAFVAAHDAREGNVPEDIVNRNDPTTFDYPQQTFDDAAASDPSGAAEIAVAAALLQKIKALGARIIYLVCAPAEQAIFYAAAAQHELLFGAGYGWITAWSDEDALLDRGGQAWPPAIEGAKGLLGVLESWNKTAPSYLEYRRLWRMHSSTLGCKSARPASYSGLGKDFKYCDVDGDDNGDPAGYSMGMADSMLILAKAFSESNNYMDASFRADPDRIYAEVKRLGSAGYDGASGRVELDESGDRRGFFDVKNMQMKSARRLEEADHTAVADEIVVMAELYIPPRFRKLAVPLPTSSMGLETVGSWSFATGLTVSRELVEFPGAVNTVPLDRVSSANLAGPVGGSVGAVVFILLIFFRLRQKEKMKYAKKYAELQESFKNTIQGVRQVNVTFDPRSEDGSALAERSRRPTSDRDAVNALAQEIATQMGISMQTQDSTDDIAKHAASSFGVQGADTRALLREVGVILWGSVDLPEKPPGGGDASPQLEAGPPIERAQWYWKEDAVNISKHNPADVKGEFIAFAGSVCRELDEKFHAFTHVGGAAVVAVDLNDRIGSTGTEQKAHNQHTGAKYEVDLKQLTQKNTTSGFTRAIQRECLHTEPAPRAKKAAAAAPNPVSRMHAEKPADIAEDDSLILYEGQMLQTSRTRPDGWAFGTVCLDIHCKDGRPPCASPGFSTSSGWFLLANTEVPTSKQFAELQKMIGGGDSGDALDALKHPDEWQAVKDPAVVQFFTLPDGVEKQAVVDAFLKTTQVKVQSVERIQNVALWQSFAVKRETILAREGIAADDEAGKARLIKRCLWHGTDEATVNKIAQQGFNRIFNGKNATMYGKGTYFARDASYSVGTTYSRPDDKGIQHMFACRVTIGEYCKGVKDAPVPDARQGYQLYDTTVNDMANPSIFVAYHDAQAYPEYLVKFKQQFVKQQ